jgi:anti-sigma B factor antagonist
MLLRLESRAVGDVMVIQCHGRIVAGNEVFTMHSQVGDSIDKYGDVVLQFDHVEFVDSSGLGAMVRLMQAARSKGGDVKLCGLAPNIRKVLQLTSLLSQFEAYDSVEEAITAAYLGSRYSRGKTGDARPSMLCVYPSTDVCTFLREVLCSAGYNAMTTTVIEDARLLLRATKTKMMIVSGRIPSIHGKPIRHALDEIDPSISLLVLDADFASRDPGEAAEKLLSDVGSLLEIRTKN